MDLNTHFATYRNRTFIIESPSGRIFKYGQFAELVQKAAALLHENECHKGDRVAVLFPNSVELAAIYFACLQSGIIIVPINAALSERGIRYIVESVQPTLIVFSICTRPIVTRTCGGVGRRQICVRTMAEKPFCREAIEVIDVVQDGLVAEEITQSPKNTPNASDLFVIYFTSGTTSQPKGVAHTGKNLIHAACAFADAVQFSEQTRIYNVWPMSNSTGFLNTVLCPFVVGGSVLLSRPFDAQTVLDFWTPVIRHQATALWLSPSMMAAMLRVDRDKKGV